MKMPSAGRIVTSGLVFLALTTSATADPIYLNFTNISVDLGASMPADPFANRGTAESLASVIDAPSADAAEFHTQSTHIWVLGGNLELDFDLGADYDLIGFHFWNYHTEGFDVDDIDLRFFDSSMTLVGSLLNIVPALGNGTGSDSTPVLAEDFALSFADVRFVNALLSGTNGQVDFNNIGFTAGVTAAVPEPAATSLLLLAGLAALTRRLRRRGQRHRS